MCDDLFPQLVGRIRGSPIALAVLEHHNDGYAIFMLAGKAVQVEYAWKATGDGARFYYSFIERVLPHCYERLRELESEAEQLVKDHWTAVLAVANELLQHSKLAAAEARAGREHDTRFSRRMASRRTRSKSFSTACGE